MNFPKLLKKFSGWILLGAGLFIIVWSLYSSYNIFTAKTLAPEIFLVEEESEPLSKETGGMDQLLKQMMGEQLKGIFPTDYLSQLMNLVSWSIFAGILIFGGSQIAGLGIKLIKR